MTKLPELMTVKEVREYLRCSNAKAYEICKSRGFPAFKIGNSYKIRRSDFCDWINEQKVKA